MIARAQFGYWVLFLLTAPAGCDGCDDTSAQGGGLVGGSTIGGGSLVGGSQASGGGGVVGANAPQGGGTSIGGNGVGGGGAAGGAPEGPPTLAIITVVGDPGGVPLEGVTVVTSNEDLSFVSETTTDANGQATQEQPWDGSISVLHNWQYGVPTDGQLEITPIRETRTYHLIGDLVEFEVHLELDSLPPPPVTPMSLSFQVDAVAGATQYEIVLSCGLREDVAVGQAFIDGYASCGGQPFDAILIARSASDVVLDYAFQTGLPFQPGADVSLDLPFSGNSLPLMSVDATFDDVDRVSVASYGLRPNGLLGATFFSEVEADNPSSPLSIAAPQVGQYATRWCGLAQLSRPSNDIMARLACDDQPLGPLTVDEGELGAISGSLANNVVIYIVDEKGPFGDGIQVKGYGLTANNEAVSWQAYLRPPTQESPGGGFLFPELPPAHAAFVPAEITFAELQHVRFTDDIGGDFIGHVASLASQNVMTLGSGYVASTLFLGP